MSSTMAMLTLMLFFTVFLFFGESKKSSDFVGLTLDKEKPIDPGQCGKSNHGEMKLVQDRLGADRVIICTDENSTFLWKTIDGSSTVGEYFDPALDCSDVVDRVPAATDGFYWINSKALPNVSKAFCDVTTDGGGFILVAKKDDPVTWTVPSSNETVDPHGKPHWSSILGKVKMLDIRFQISTTSKFKDTKAHWSFRFTNKRPFGELLVRNFGGCTRDNPGIGDIAFVKDLQTGKVVNKNFRCSVFSGHVSSLIGWGKMNKCLQQPCSLGFAYFPGLKNLRLEDSGSYSYSAHGNSTNSGILHSSTAFVGCSHKKCCACYGPKGGKKNYCLTNCTSINGGIVKKKVHVWIWIRSSIPTRAWRKCVEYTVTDKNGKKETYSVDEETGIRREGSCAYSDEIKKNGAVLVVPNEDAVKKIPSAPGLLLYRPDKETLSVRGAKDWKKIAMHNEVKYQQQLLNQQVNRTEEKLEKQKESLENKISFAQIVIEKKLKNEQLVQQEKLEKLLNDSRTQRKALEKELAKLEKRLNSTFGLHFMDSQILRGKSNYIKQLSLWVPFATSWSLCYRATRDGWSSYTFHSKCDYKGATVTIIRVGSYIFGGYSDASWGGWSRFRGSWNSFIFSFVNRYNLPPFKSSVYRNSQNAIYTYSVYGPTFGGGHDINIRNNARSSTDSYTNFGHTYRPPSGYSYGSSKTQSLLAGSYNFRPSEIEVFYVN